MHWNTHTGRCESYYSFVHQNDLGAATPNNNRQPIPVLFLPRKLHGQRKLAGHSPWGCTESVMPEVTEHCVIYLEVSKKVDLKHSHRAQKQNYNYVK